MKYDQFVLHSLFADGSEFFILCNKHDRKKAIAVRKVDELDL
ncbi:hypothetical protein [Nostoc sp.]